MEIIVHGRVVFENGEIVSIEGWHIKGGNADDLMRWVRGHYSFHEMLE